MLLKLKDSYLKKSFEITDKQSLLKLYSCGPTVYNYQSIGNMRAVWLPDTITKTAKLLGYQTQWVLNITDVGHLVSDGDEGEDKIEKGAKRDGKTVQEIVDYYTNDFKNQCETLHFDLPEGKNNPKATDYIPEQMVLALQLLADKKAYILEDGIYFDFVNSLDSLEILAKKYPLLAEVLSRIEKQQTGNNGDFTGRAIKNTEKNPSDFALWKFVAENTLQKWRFEDFAVTKQYLDKIQNTDIGGKWGCPGWHSECVCMIAGVFDQKFADGCDFNSLSEPQKVITIHTGGEDHIDVHHKNEILQSFALGFNLSEHWVHNRFVMVDGGKMSKSLGNVYLVTGKKEITGFKSLTEEGFDPLAYRLMLMETKYDEKLDFTWEKMAQSQARLYNLRKESGKILGLIENSVQGDVEIYADDLQQDIDYQKLIGYLAENLNTPKFVEEYQTLLVETAKNIQNKIQQNGVLSSIEDKELFIKSTVLGYLENNVLQLDMFTVPDEHVFELADDRLEAKNDKNWQKADEIRQHILSHGWQVDDLGGDKYSIWKKDY